VTLMELEVDEYAPDQADSGNPPERRPPCGPQSAAADQPAIVPCRSRQHFSTSFMRAMEQPTA
jgi:hypothetical protein